jgi:hypothetical protein
MDTPMCYINCGVKWSAGYQGISESLGPKLLILYRGFPGSNILMTRLDCIRMQ